MSPRNAVQLHQIGMERDVSIANQECTIVLLLVDVSSENEKLNNDCLSPLFLLKHKI